MANPKRFSVELTLGEIIELTEVIKTSYSGLSYGVDRITKDPVEELSDWQVRDAETGAEKRVKLAALITTITGEAFGDPDEVGRVTQARKAYDAHKAALDSINEPA